MAKLARDGATPPGGSALLHPRESLFTSGNLGSVNAEIMTVCDGASTVSLDLRGTFSLTVEVAGSVDGVNWNLIPMQPVNQASVIMVAAITGATQGLWVGKCSAYRIIRARVTAYTSGAAAAFLCAENGLLDDSLNRMITALPVTNTGAAGAAVTLTLPAPGAGLRQYLTYLSIYRFATALLTAAATPVLISTTNILGSLVFSRDADALPQGKGDPWREDLAFPIPAAALNTVMTFVCPATPLVIWRATAGYYVAP